MNTSRDSIIDWRKRTEFLRETSFHSRDISQVLEISRFVFFVFLSKTHCEITHTNEKIMFEKTPTQLRWVYIYEVRPNIIHQKAAIIR